MTKHTFELRKPKSSSVQDTDYITSDEAKFRNTILKLNNASIRWIKQTSLIVTDFNGGEVNVKNMQQSLRVDFPSFARKDIDDYGTPFLANCAHKTTRCGCEIIGNGTLQFPLMIKFCDKHK